MRSMRRVVAGLGVLAACMGAACTNRGAPPPTADEARQFVEHANAELKRVDLAAEQSGWVAQNFITDDTEAIGARAAKEYSSTIAALAKEAVRFANVDVAPDVRRQLDLLKLSLVLATPADDAKAEELTTIMARLEATYGKGKWCADPAKPDTCLNIDDITAIMASSRDPTRLREVWEGWRTVSPPMRKDYQRFVELSNEGARELGFADTGAMWRAKYDMPPDDFTAELERLWGQVEPLYRKLHAYVRMKLRQKYGDLVPADGPIPAYLLGNIWAQDWSNVYDLVAPPAGGAGYDLTKLLQQRHTGPLDMVRMGERFYTSLGFAPLPPTFWERSLFTRPADREVVCHASAWDIDMQDDIRIKVCLTPTAEDFTTIHHELGHNFYQRAYSRQPPLFRDGANDGFHEAIGDTIALSVTPEYLVKIGLLDRAPDASRDIGLLLSRALEKVAFLPFGLLIDQWRWQVFSGAVPPDQYNTAWWDLRLKYQGIAPPSPRSEEFFDPGAKYHIPDNTPYMRYFLAYILEFQFHRALSEAAGCTLPLHRCSIYESQAAGQKLNAMLEMGRSKPWQDALEEMTGSRQMDASAILDYFAPLSTWLDEQLKGQPIGW